MRCVDDPGTDGGQHCISGQAAAWGEEQAGGNRQAEAAPSAQGASVTMPMAAAGSVGWPAACWLSVLQLAKGVQT